jgi:N6-L-threonylcarbamoyladenine synthase
LLGLPYPGGPEIERLARQGDSSAVPLPRAWLGQSLDFSFSGLKTALARFVKQEGLAFRLEDVAASLEASVVDVLVTKTVRAARATGVRSVAIGGGVAANRSLAAAMAAACESEGIRCVAPPASLCTDNAAMVAAAGIARLLRGHDDGATLDTMASDPLPRIAVGGDS